MSMTPGPWEWDWGESDNLYNADYLAKLRERRAIYRAGGVPPEDFPPHWEPIVQTDSRVYGPNDDDARLIAAAPDMPATLEMLALGGCTCPCCAGAAHDVRAVIAKATGGGHG